MQEGQSSATARGAAMMRAAHLILDEDPNLFRDHLALQLSGLESQSALQASIGALQGEIAHWFTPEIAPVLVRNIRANLVMRQRYTEDELDKALKRGVTQYVILGAGLDSFAYRRHDLTGVLNFFEVDHPAAQQWKRGRLRELNITLPGNLTFVPVDFEQQTLAGELCAGGYRSELPAFVSWLGVTPYLTEGTVFETLRYAASLAAGSKIVFEYEIADSLLDEKNRQLAAALKAIAAARGEPVLSMFEPAALAARVKALGFSQMVDFGPQEANTRYFAGSTDGLCAWSLTRLMKAHV
jgi:methyltransferase (TIGR00027 family)